MKTPKKPLKPIHKVLAELIPQKGKTNKEVAKKLSEIAKKKVSPQLLGMYRRGQRTPGSDFILLWEETFTDRLMDLAKQYETDVPRETKVTSKHTQGVEAAGKKKNSPTDEEREILIESLKQFGETNAYLLKRIKELGG